MTFIVLKLTATQTILVGTYSGTDQLSFNTPTCSSSLAQHITRIRLSHNGILPLWQQNKLRLFVGVKDDAILGAIGR